MPPQRTFPARLAANPEHFVTVHTTGDWTARKAESLGVVFDPEDALMPRPPPEKQTVTIKGTWSPEDLDGFGALHVDWPDVPPGVTQSGSGMVAGRPVNHTSMKRNPPAPRHLLCWLLGHAPYSDGAGSTHCARCLRRMP